MKLKILLCSLLLLYFAGANAQTVLIDEGFEDVGSWDDSTRWFVSDLDQDSYSWQFSQPFNNLGFTGSIVFSRSLLLGETPEENIVLDPDNILISPPITLLEGLSELTYKVGSLHSILFQENYSVYAVGVAEFVAAAAAGVTVVQDFLDSESPVFSGEVTDQSATEITLSLSNFANQQILLIFRHHNSPGVWALLLDDIKVVSDDNVSVNKELASKFAVFPNPTYGIVNISNSGNSIVSKVEVRDLNGRKIQSFDVNLANEGNIDVSHLQAGLYFLNFVTTDGEFSKKLIKK